MEPSMLIQLPVTTPGLKPDAKTTVRRWLRKVGEVVSAGQPLVELETDDAILHVQAPTDGVVEDVRVAAADSSPAAPEISSRTPEISVKAPEISSRTPDSSAGAQAVAGVTPVLMPQAGNTMEEG